MQVKPKQNKAARQLLVAARTSLLVQNGFFGFLALQLQLVEATEINGQKLPTMAVDGKHFYYNPEFTLKLSDREREGVVCHEVEHCALQHMVRRGNRDPRIWNMACDFVINLDIIEAGFQLPGTPYSMDQLKRGVKAEGIYLYDQSLKGKNAEAVYEMIMEHVQIVTVAFGMIGDGADNQDAGGCGGVLDAPGSTSEKQEVGQVWEVSVRVALETAKANNAGNVPASLQSLLRQFSMPKVSWKERTRRFIDQSLTRDVSWSRISRRSASIGVLMPGYVADRLRQLVFFVDISGSISPKLIHEMVTEVAGALNEGTADIVTVVYADTRVQHVDEYVQGDIITVGKYSGGGTDFADSFRWLRENAPDASCVIYLTDLQVYNFGEAPDCPVLWAVYSPDELYDQLAARAPFGECIHISKTYY